MGIKAEDVNKEELGDLTDEDEQKHENYLKMDDHMKKRNSTIYSRDRYDGLVHLGADPWQRRAKWLWLCNCKFAKQWHGTKTFWW